MTRPDCEETIRILVAQAWDHEIDWPQISAWTKNFTGDAINNDDEEQLYALYMLSRFMYFSKKLIREMLKSLYRDYFMGPLIQRIRRNSKDTHDIGLLKSLFNSELELTRFIGVGNPAESGAHLLYYFRQVNYLSKDLFTDFDSAFSQSTLRSPKQSKNDVFLPRNPGIKRYVFFDDLVGTGLQSKTYLKEKLEKIRNANLNLEIRFMCLFSSTKGLDFMNSSEMFNGKASCLFELDKTYTAFDQDQRYFSSSPDWFTINTLYNIAYHYGSIIRPNHPLGYGKSQLLLGFTHNTPDNTLPIFWDEGHVQPWSPIFQRYNKVY